MKTNIIHIFVFHVNSGSIALDLDETDFENRQFIENECVFCDDGLRPTISNKEVVGDIFDIRIAITQVMSSFNVPLDELIFA